MDVASRAGIITVATVAQQTAMHSGWQYSVGASVEASDAEASSLATDAAQQP